MASATLQRRDEQYFTDDCALSCASGLRDYIVLDIEFSQGSREVAAMLEIAMIKFQNGCYHSCYETLLHPGEVGEITNVRAHGITNAMVVDAPHFSDVAKDVYDFVRDCPILIGQNIINTDIPFVNCKLQQANLPPLTCDFIDTWTLAQIAFPDFGKYRLEFLAKHFGISSGTAHAAMNDVMTTNRLLCLCSENLKSPINWINVHPQSVQRHDANEARPRNRNKVDFSAKNFNPKDIIAETSDFDTSHPFYEKVLVFTGTLGNYKREQLAQMAANKGARETARDISQKVNFLVVCGQGDEGTSEHKLSRKEQKAIESNTKKTKPANIIRITGEEFLSLLEGGNFDAREKFVGYD